MPAARTAGKRTIVYASWNGATTVSRWRVLAGPGPARLQPAATAPWEGFETAITLRAEPYVAVVALDGQGQVLARSRTVAVR